MAISAIFDKVRWVRGSWGASEVDLVSYAVHDTERNSEPYYKSSADSKSYALEGEGACIGMCAEGAIEYDLGVPYHGDGQYLPDYTSHPTEVAAKRWVLQGDWFRKLLTHIGKHHATRFMRDYATARYHKAEEVGDHEEANYWDFVSACDNIPEFNDHASTKETDVREFLDVLERSDTYINIQYLCKRPDWEIEVFRKGYIERLVNKEYTYTRISRMGVYQHYEQLLAANVI